MIFCLNTPFHPLKSDKEKYRNMRLKHPTSSLGIALCMIERLSHVFGGLTEVTPTAKLEHKESAVFYEHSLSGERECHCMFYE